MIGFVHSLFSLVLAIVFNLNPAVAVVASLLPDVDIILPIQHREIFHSVLFMVLVSLLFRFRFGKKHASAFAVGFSSHLFLDIFSKAGVKLFWPVDYSFSLPLMSSNTANLSVLVICLVFLLNMQTKSFIFRED